MKLDKIQTIANNKMEAVNDFAKKLNDPETRKQILDDTKEQLSKGMDAAKKKFSDVQSKGMDVAKNFMGSMFGKESVPVNGGKRKSKKQENPRKEEKKIQENKSKKNKSKKSNK